MVAPRMPGDASLVQVARALARRARAEAAAIERDRRVPLPLVQDLANAGLFRLGVPEKLGGIESDVQTMLRVIEEIARADGSTGWVVMIGATSGVVSAYLQEDVAREIYTDPSVVTGGVFAPMGTAVRAGGGYRVDGRWSYASGCQHCAWLMGGCVVHDDGKPRRLPSGAPDARMFLFPATAVEIIDTWNVAGLCGTGSHDIAVRDTFVPAGRSVSLIADRPVQPGPLYTFPVFGLLALGIAAVALGIARRAIDELVDLAGAKTPGGSRRRLSERGAIQSDVARAESTFGAARSYLFQTVNEIWANAVARGEISAADRARLRLAATHAVWSCAPVVDSMYGAGGGTSVYAASPLQRCFRDVHVLTQHMMVAPTTYELTGRILLGVETDTSML